MAYDQWLDVWDKLDNGMAPNDVFWALHFHMIEVDIEFINDVYTQLQEQRHAYQLAKQDL